MGAAARRRWARRVIGVCTLGAATTLAVAWGLAFRSVGGGAPVAGARQVTADDFYEVGVLVSRAPGACVIESTIRSGNSAWAARMTASRADDVVPVELRRAAMPWVFENGAPDEARHGTWRLVNARGWPLRAVYCERFTGSGGVMGRRGAIVVEGAGVFTYGGGWGETVVLPWLPLWAGIVGDTLFYGGAWSGAWTLVVWRRRRRRERRGMCRACGYDLRGLSAGGVCPECGRPAVASPPESGTGDAGAAIGYEPAAQAARSSARAEGS